MKQISHEQKVLWQLYCMYSYISAENYYRKSYSWELCYPKRIKLTRISKKQWDFINHWYYYITNIDSFYRFSKKTFVKDLEDTRYRGQLQSPYHYKKNRRISFICNGDRIDRYRRKSYHKKKHLSNHQINKNDWREKKRTRKDKSKSYWKRGPQKYYKKLSNRMHRQWTKQKLHNRDWDLNEKEYKFFVDSWCWD